MTSSRWTHVLDGHPEIAPFLHEVLRTVRKPHVITPDSQDGRWRYWHSGAGPSRWLYVVVEWHAAAPHVVTAYGKRKDPP